MRTRARRLILIVFGLAVALGAGGAAADTPSLPSLRYSMHFGGFHVVDLRFEGARSGEQYDAELDIRTTGLADMVVRYRGRADVDGVVGDGALRPERYGFTYSSRKSRRVVEVDYDPASGDAKKVRSEKRGKEDRVDVPRDLWNDVTDPLSAFLMLREHLALWRDDGPPRYVAEIFDGRRRYVFDARVTGTVGYGRGADRAIAVNAVIKPLAGFDLDDMTDRERREGYRVRALFSADERLLPLEIRTLNTSITVTIRLAGCTGRACATASTGRAKPAG